MSRKSARRAPVPDEAGSSGREVREGIQRGFANAKAGRTSPAQRVFDELRRKHAIPHNDEARQRLRADVYAGFDQLARGEAQPFDKASARQLADRIKARGRAASAHAGPLEAFESVKAVGLALPDVEATTNWAGAPVLKVHGTFVAGLASHRSVEPGTLVVRCALDDRERFLEDAPDTYYVTDYYRPYPVVLARLSHLNPDALRDLLTVSWRKALDKIRKPTRRRSTRQRIP